ISMLAGDNGILRQAASAKKNTDEQSTIEQIKLAATAAITNEEHKIKNLQEELDKQFGVGKATATPIDGGYKVTVNDITQIISESGTVRNETEVEKNVGKEITGNKVTLTDENGEKIVVPARFTIKEGAATQVKDGIVVVAPDESEFVWVPVEDINKMAMCQGRTTTSECKLEKENDKIVCKTHNKPLCGKLYATSLGEKFDSDLKTQIFTTNSGLREPALLNSYDTNSQYYNTILGYDNSADFEKDMQDEFDKMIKSVVENKGFYVGRYENSLREENIIQSVKDAIVATAVDSCNTWYGLYKKNKEYSEKNNLTKIVGSSMIWGSQYDQMLIWMKENGGDVTTAIGDNRNKGNNGNSVGTTGTVQTDKIKNIYDLYGSAREWTLEAYRTDFRNSRRRKLLW
ncbi:MAG: hypothetical protein HFJ17_02015, partial [Clostridia bacterium]|nr:hypothetical protein [Clostridia bacterium]